MPDPVIQMIRLGCCQIPFKHHFVIEISKGNLTKGSESLMTALQPLPQAGGDPGRNNGFWGQRFETIKMTGEPPNVFEPPPNPIKPQNHKFLAINRLRVKQKAALRRPKSHIMLLEMPFGASKAEMNRSITRSKDL